MYQSNWSFNIPLPHPRATPRAFELLKIGLLKFPPLGAKKPFKCPTNYYWNTSPQGQISSSIKHCSYFSERDMLWWHFKLLLKTLLKELFTNKGKILSCKSIKPCKNQKHSREYCTGTKDKSGSNSPPLRGNVQIPPFPGTMQIQMPGAGGGGCWSFNLTGTTERARWL